MGDGVPFPRRYPCSVCNLWLIAAEFPECDVKSQPIVCVACREKIRRENDEE